MVLVVLATTAHAAYLTGDWLFPQDIRTDHNGYFGWYIAGGGDTNGDGYNDILVGAYAENAVYLYRGSAGGIDASSELRLAPKDASGLGTGLDFAGDVNGDGYDDILISASTSEQAYLYLGSADGISASDAIINLPPNALNTFDYVSSAGDVNGDGYDDVLISDIDYWDSWEGQVHLYYGSADGLETTPHQTLDGGGQWFGYKTDTVGDLNGDGYDDVLISDIDQSAYLYYGSASGLGDATTISPIKDSPIIEFKYEVSVAGDLNGDGYNDILLIGYGESPDAHGVAFYGSATGIDIESEDVFSPSDVRLTGSNFGPSISGIGDINGDGYNDIIIGAPETNTMGQAFLYYGTSEGFNGKNPITINPTGTPSGWYFGMDGVGLGDIDGDGLDDFAIGAPAFFNPDVDAHYLPGGVVVYRSGPDKPTDSSETGDTGGTGDTDDTSGVSDTGDTTEVPQNTDDDAPEPEGDKANCSTTNIRPGASLVLAAVVLFCTRRRQT